MTPVTDKAGELAPWTFSINYGPDGEENYANVYDGTGQLVGNLRTHFARQICESMNRRTPSPPHMQGMHSAVDAIMRAKMQIDEVSGKRMWLCHEADGRGEVTELEVVELAAETFAPGTEILIYEPAPHSPPDVPLLHEEDR